MTTLGNEDRNPERAIDLLISHATLLAKKGPQQEIPDCSIAITDGGIVAVGSDEELRSCYLPLQVIDATGMLAMPGLINGHNHLFQVMCRGLGDGCDLSNWAATAIWPVAHNMDRAACEVAAALACVEMIESGVTTVVDSHYLHALPGSQEGIAQGCLAAGIRAILGRAAMDTPDVPEPFRETVEQAVSSTSRFISMWNGRDNRITTRPEAMSEVAASRQMILGLRDLSREAGVGFHMHAAEEQSRPEQLEREVGSRTIAYLDQLGVLGPDVVLAHCVWLNHDEIMTLATTETSVIHNPVSNQFLADGVAPVPEFLAKGVKVGLGSDGAASNDSADMFEIMKSTALLHKISSMRSDVLGAEEVLEMATIGGARALGIDDQVGSLDPGKRADIVLLQLDAPRMVPRHDICRNLVYSASSQLVDTVIIEGHIVARRGKCISLDRDLIVHEALSLGRRLSPDKGVGKVNPSKWE